MRLRTAFCSYAVLAAMGCSPGEPPALPPQARPRPILPLPPWQARLSVAEGYEAKAPAGPPVVITGATVMLGNGRSLAHGTVILDKGKILAVGEGDLPPPAGAVFVDGRNKFITPGLIDTHSHLGVYPMISSRGTRDGNEMSDPVTPQAQAVDAFWPQDPGIERAVAGGVTAIQVLPGSGNLIGGRAITIKLRPSVSPREMHVPGALDGLKMACGENPKRSYGESKRAPMTRMGNLALQRAAFLKAKKLQEQWARWRESEARRIETDARKRAEFEAKKRDRAPDEPAPAGEPAASEPIATPDRDPGTETLVAALEGRVLVHVHCYRADDMLAMIALSDEIGFRIRSFHHALEAYKIRGQLAQRQISVSTWADWWGFKMEAFDGIPENMALIHESGGRPIIHSDSDEGIQRLNQEAAKALASGRSAGVMLTDADAITWVTMNPAWALGVDHRMGSIEKGKDADIVLWSANPLSVYAVAEKVWIDGALAYARGQRRWSDFEVGQEAVPPPPRPARPAGKEEAL